MSLESPFHKNAEMAAAAAPHGLNSVDILGPRLSANAEKATPMRMASAWDEGEFRLEESIAIELLQQGLRGKALQDGIKKAMSPVEEPKEKP